MSSAAKTPQADADERGPSLRARALRLLGRREHSRLELARKLERHAGDEGELEALLDELEANGWLSERRVAEQVVRAAAGRFGVRKMSQQLRDKGVSAEVAAETIAQARAGSLENALTAWRKRFNVRPSNAGEWSRQARFLAQRGFDGEVIRRVLGGKVEQEEE